MSVSCLFRVLTVGACGLLASAGLLAQPRSVHSQNEVTRDHHLFVGTELGVRHGEELIPVRRIKGNDLLLAAPFDDYVSIRRSSGLVWRMITKVAVVSATIEALETRQTSSANLEAFNDQARLQMTMDDQAMLIEQSQGQLIQQAQQASVLANSSIPEERELGEVQLENLATEMSSLDSDLFNTTGAIESLHQPDGSSSEEFEADSLELLFKISSEVELPAAYVFVTVRLRSDETFHDIGFHRHLQNIGPKPRKVRLIRRGFPVGFEVIETKIHLFCYGEEIPTNLSEKRYPLSYDEAKEFLQLSHVGENRHGTLPAQPAWSLVPPEILQNESPQILDFPVTVDLDETGSIVAIHDSGQVIPDRVQSLVAQLTFLPALQNGKPVESTLTVNPADFYKE